MGGKKRLAVTVDELGGSASSRVDFIRTDARAAKRATPSNTHLKDTLSSPFDIARGLTGPASAAVIRQLVTLRTAAPEQPGLVIGLGAVTRRLQRGELRAVVMAGAMHPALLVAHIPVQAARAAVPLCILECSSAQLGQPFGLLRAAAIGFTSDSFDLEHPLIRLLADSAAAPPAWLEAAAAETAAAEAAAAAAQQQEQGNAHFRSGQWAAAVASYSEALGLLSPAISKLRHPGAVADGIDATDVTDACGRASAGGTPGEPDVVAKLRANRAAALLKLGRHAEAL